MWHIYISIAVLFKGAYCNPVINTAGHSNCTVEIKRFGEQVTTLEVKWHSTIHLICDASCVGPGPQPGLTWFYRDKNQNKHFNIEKLFRSPKFQTYSTNFHRKNELVIRDFGPNEETDFICKGSVKNQRLQANVTLIGTDCLLKYNFRCPLDNKCIDRAYLCNQNNECRNGEDEVGCGNDMNATTTVATIRMPEKGVETEETLDENNYIDMTTTVSTMLMPETDVETIQISKDTTDLCLLDEFRCLNQRKCVPIAFRCNGILNCEDGSDEADCGKSCEFQCRNGTCISSTKKCDGIPDCPDGDDEICEIPPICPEGKKACKDLSKCIDDSQLCNGVQDCTDGGDEKNCGLGTEPQTSKAPQQKDDGKYDVAEEKKKIIMVGTGINDDGDTGLLSTTDGVTDNTGEFTDTTPFDYDFYANN